MQAATKRGWTMRKVKAKTADLLKAIRENYEKHKADYAEAFEGYKATALEKLAESKVNFEKWLAVTTAKVQTPDLSKGDKPVGIHNPHVLNTPPVPESHASDYEVVIRMLEFETSETVEIETDQFECYVMDRWEWKDRFTALNATYSGKSMK